MDGKAALKLVNVYIAEITVNATKKNKDMRQASKNLALSKNVKWDGKFGVNILMSLTNLKK